MEKIIRQRPLQPLQNQLPSTMPEPVQRVLMSRGIASEAELSTRMQALLPPASLGGVEKAAKAVCDAIEQDQSILVVGDFDADGATGTALAVLALRAMGAVDVDFRVPNRFEFGYGLTVPLVETLADNRPDVLVTVDSGISCIAGVKRAKELGCRVIVTDHHLPGDHLPPADAIVNPNCPGDEFPSKSLAGVGVMFYLLSVIRRQLRERNWFKASRPEPALAQFLDLVALGTVADLVPLDRNNRVLVQQGLARIRQGLARPGLLALMRLGKRDYRYAAANDLGFAVGPRLNAAGRLEDMATGIRCLICDDPDQAMTMAQSLDELNAQRKELQGQMQSEAMAQAARVLEDIQEGETARTALCLFDENWHQGIVGLVASRVKDSVHRPVIAFAPEESGSEKLKGSARSVRGLHIRDVLAYVDSHNPGLISAFGGHAMAAGLSLNKSALSDFQQALEEGALATLDGAELSNKVMTDGALAGKDQNLGMARWFEDLGPWGQRFPEPLFDGKFHVVDARVVGGSHLKMIVRSADGGAEMDAIAFNRLPEDLPASGPVRMLYHLSINRWRGQQSCQLMVTDLLD